MKIERVMSFRDGWHCINEKNNVELHDVMHAIGEVFERRSPDFSVSRGELEKILISQGWLQVGTSFTDKYGRKVNIGRLGPVKNGISVQFFFSVIETLSHWVFQRGALAVKHGVIAVPVLLVPMRGFSKKISSPYNRSHFEILEAQIELLTPLNHNYPFVIIGFGDGQNKQKIRISELPANMNDTAGERVVDRCITFPPEYHQAGLGILNFFGTYLREQYPDEEVTVRIEQQGLTVRLIVNDINGRIEVIERALEEYELIVTGKADSSKFTDNDKLILELRNELRIAKARVEFQSDVISLQDSRIEKFLNIVGDALSKPASVIDFRPSFNNSNTIQANPVVASAIGAVNEILEYLPKSSDDYSPLSEVGVALEKLEKQTDAETVRRSSGMSKFRRVLDGLLEKSKKATDAINGSEETISKIQDLAKKYNAIAEWCGLPVVPAPFLK